MMRAKRLTTFILLSIAIAALTACSPVAVEDPVPMQIKNLAMGAKSAAVNEMINGSGGVVTGVSRDKRGPEITWTPTASPYYQTIDFDFTEKDRLYIVRYNMKEGPREEFQGVKNAFFDLHKFQRDDPARIRLGGNDALLYIIPDDNVTYLFEITDKKTGGKSIEIFDRRVSAQDRPEKPGQASQQSGDQPKTSPEPEKAQDKVLDQAPDKGPDKGSEPESK